MLSPAPRSVHGGRRRGRDPPGRRAPQLPGPRQGRAAACLHPDERRAGAAEIAGRGRGGGGGESRRYTRATSGWRTCPASTLSRASSAATSHHPLGRRWDRRGGADRPRARVGAGHRAPRRRQGRARVARHLVQLANVLPGRSYPVADAGDQREPPSGDRNLLHRPPKGPPAGREHAGCDRPRSRRAALRAGRDLRGERPAGPDAPRWLGPATAHPQGGRGGGADRPPTRGVPPKPAVGAGPTPASIRSSLARSLAYVKSQAGLNLTAFRGAAVIALQLAAFAFANS